MHSLSSIFLSLSLFLFHFPLSLPLSLPFFLSLSLWEFLIQKVFLTLKSISNSRVADVLHWANVGMQLFPSLFYHALFSLSLHTLLMIRILSLSLSFVPLLFNCLAQLVCNWAVDCLFMTSLISFLLTSINPFENEIARFLLSFSHNYFLSFSSLSLNYFLFHLLIVSLLL